MDCPHPEQLSMFLDGELPPQAHATIETHLPGCPVCRLALADLRDIRAALAVKDGRPSDSETEQALRRMRRVVAPRRKPSPTPAFALAGLLVAAFGLGWSFGKPAAETTRPHEPRAESDGPSGDFSLARFDGGGRATIRVVRQKPAPNTPKGGSGR